MDIDGRSGNSIRSSPRPDSAAAAVQRCFLGTVVPHPPLLWLSALPSDWRVQRRVTTPPHAPWTATCVSWPGLSPMGRLWAASCLVLCFPQRRGACWGEVQLDRVSRPWPWVHRQNPPAGPHRSLHSGSQPPLQQHLGGRVQAWLLTGMALPSCMPGPAVASHPCPALRTGRTPGVMPRGAWQAPRQPCWPTSLLPTTSGCHLGRNGISPQSNSHPPSWLLHTLRLSGLDRLPSSPRRRQPVQRVGGSWRCHQQAC